MIINKSSDQNNSNVVFFKRNLAGWDSPAIAWRVISLDGTTAFSEFSYNTSFFISTQDSYGNISDPKEAKFGQNWKVFEIPSGKMIKDTGAPAIKSDEIELKNQLMKGSINAHLYNEGFLIAAETGIAPGQKGIIGLDHHIYVGVSSQVKEGEEINSAILNDINQSFSLVGITKAELIVTGGGQGPNAEPFQFELVPLSYA